MRLPWGWAAICVILAAATAHAQIASDEFGIERFRLSPDESSILDVDSADVGEHLTITGGLAIGFAHAPLVIYDDSMTAVHPLVDQRLTTDIVGSIALYDRVQLGVGVDVIGYQTGVEGLTLDKLPSGGIGDIRLMTKVLLVEGVAFAPTLIVPAGDARGWLREAGVSFAPEIAVSRTRGQLRGAVNVGYRMRKRVDVAGLVSDDEAFARIGAAARFDRVGELWWSTSVAAPLSDRERNVTAIEMLFGGTRRVTPLVNVFIAGGVGLDNGFGVPDWRALAGVRFDREPRVVHVVTPPRETLPAPVPVVVVEPPPPPPPPKTKLAGTIATATGQAIPGATITIDTEAGPLEVVADDDGKFATEVTGQLGKLRASAPGYDAGEAEIVVENGTAQVTVALKRSVRSGQLRGQVLSFDGKPLAATVRAGDKTATADADGQFTIDLPAGAFQVTIEAPGYITQKRSVKVKLDGVTVLNVDLRGGK
jgi:hypothetical protein